MSWNKPKFLGRDWSNPVFSNPIYSHTEANDFITHEQLKRATTDGASEPPLYGAGTAVGLNNPSKPVENVVAEGFTDLFTPVLGPILYASGDTDTFKNTLVQEGLSADRDRATNTDWSKTGILDDLQEGVVRLNEDSVRDGLTVLGQIGKSVVSPDTRIPFKGKLITDHSQLTSAVGTDSKPLVKGEGGFKVKDKMEGTSKAQNNPARNNQHFRNGKPRGRGGRNHAGNTRPLAKGKPQNTGGGKGNRPLAKAKRNAQRNNGGYRDQPIKRVKINPSGARNLGGRGDVLTATYASGGVVQPGNVTKFFANSGSDELTIMTKCRLGPLVCLITSGGTSLQITGATADTNGQYYFNPTNACYIPAVPLQYFGRLFDRYRLDGFELVFNTAIGSSDKYQITWCACESVDHWDRLNLTNSNTTPSKSEITMMPNSGTFPAWTPEARIALPNRGNPLKNPWLYTSTSEGVGTNGTYDWNKEASGRQSYGCTAGIRVDGAIPAATFTVGDIYLVTTCTFKDMSGYLLTTVLSTSVERRRLQKIEDEKRRDSELEERIMSKIMAQTEKLSLNLDKNDKLMEQIYEELDTDKVLSQASRDRLLELDSKVVRRMPGESKFAGSRTKNRDLADVYWEEGSEGSLGVRSVRTVDGEERSSEISKKKSSSVKSTN